MPLTALSTSGSEKKSLAECALSLEQACLAIDSADEITPEMAKALCETKHALSDKVDRWIAFLDLVKQRIELHKERKERAQKAQKVGETLLKRLKDYMTFTLQQNPSVRFAGQDGQLYLHKNPPGIDVTFELQDKSIHGAVPETLIALEPSLFAYCKEVKFLVLDREKLKRDLDAGMDLSWAKKKQDSHVRVR